jgi:hypothetical protein
MDNQFFLFIAGDGNGVKITQTVLLLFNKVFPAIQDYSLYEDKRILGNGV